MDNLLRQQLDLRDQLMSSSYNFIISLLQENYNNIENAEFKTTFSSALKDSLKKLIKIDNSNEIKKNIFMQLLEEEFEDITQLNQRYELLLQQNKIIPKEHEYMTTFVEELMKLENKGHKVNNKSGEDDEDEELICINKEKFNVICPISRKKMTNPYRNIHCGHIYEYACIMHLLETNRKTKCPMAGCIHQRKMTSKDIEPDLELKEKLKDIPD